ncbi:O-methyltransferase [Piscibacillus salipiscarius]|uniref:O-methyltransferase n=1 Tax=Piscibacillus salipiscarius TaxID=299480 RepID=UPI000A7C727F|nr:class I SAM-dependent methyltransferase [Piscibacillus salipiscarius]
MPTNKQYIQDLYSLNKQALLLEEMEHYASLHSVPIIERDGVELLKQLIRLHKPNQILEIGTAIGYSAIQMASANCETQITSIEIDEERFHIASKNVEKVDMTDRIHLILEDANQYLNQLKMNNLISFC